MSFRMVYTVATMLAIGAVQASPLAITTAAVSGSQHSHKPTVSVKETVIVAVEPLNGNPSGYVVEALSDDPILRYHSGHLLPGDFPIIPTPKPTASVKETVVIAVEPLKGNPSGYVAEALPDDPIFRYDSDHTLPNDFHLTSQTSASTPQLTPIVNSPATMTKTQAFKTSMSVYSGSYSMPYETTPTMYKYPSPTRTLATDFYQSPTASLPYGDGPY